MNAKRFRVAGSDRIYEADLLAGTYFFARHAMPESADGPFCLIDRCGEFYNTDGRPRTPAERVSTLMLVQDWVYGADGKPERTGPLRPDLGLSSELHPAHRVRHGYVAAEITLLDHCSSQCQDHPIKEKSDGH